MPEILGLVCLLAAVTIVGHAIWVAIASLFKKENRRASPGATAPGVTPCPRCGLPARDAGCRACGWRSTAVWDQPQPRAGLESLSWQLDRLQQLGVLDSQTIRNLHQAIDQETKRLEQTVAPAVDEYSRPCDVAVSDEVPVAVEVPLTVELVSESAPLPAPMAALGQAAPGARDDREFVSPVPLSQRAERLLTSASTASDMPAAPKPSPPKRTWADLLSAFMEERNMRWGELVGGLLIVCGSIALVVSFWSAIAERPWLKFFVFNGVTAALFGVGFYSEHRWRLKTTSQGLLIIACLLVPLNFLAIAALSNAPASDGPLTIMGELISAGIFVALVYHAGRILSDHGAVWFVIGVLVPSLSELLVRRFVGPSTAIPLLATLAAVPLSSYLVTNGWVLRRVGRQATLAETQVNSLFKFAGVTTFSTLLPLALLLVKTEQPLETVRHLPIFLGLIGLVPISLGLLLWQRLVDRTMSAFRTAGLSIAICGALVSSSAVVLSWPRPLGLLSTALVEFAIFTIIAWWYVLPAAHLLAAGCLAIVYIVGIYLARGEISADAISSPEVARQLISGRTGWLLPPLVAGYAICAWWFRLGRTHGARYLAGVAAAIAAISTGLVSWFGAGVAGDPVGAAWIYLLYAAACILASARLRYLSMAWLGSGLLLAASVQGVVFRFGAIGQLALPEVLAILVYCTLAVAIAIAVRSFRLALNESPLAATLWQGSFGCSLVAAAWLIAVTPAQSAAILAADWFWISLVWLAIALSRGWLPIWSMFQVALNVTAIFGVVSLLERQSWFSQSSQPWLDPWTLSGIGIALTGLNLAWAVLRLVARRRFVRIQELFATPWLGVDRFTTAGLVALLVLLGTYAALPGVLQELSLREPSAGAIAANPPPRIVPPIEDFQWHAIPNQHAAGPGTWLFLIGLACLLPIVMRDIADAGWLLNFFLVAAVGCPLLASRFESQVAVASALRWLSILFLMLASVPIWARNRINEVATRFGWPAEDYGPRLLPSARALVLGLGIGPSLAMAIGIGAQAMDRPPRAAFWNDAYILFVVGCASTIVAGLIWIAASRVAKVNRQHVLLGGAQALSALLMVLGLAPILSVIIYDAGIGLRAHPILGPNPDSIFVRMGLSSSYAFPIAMIALTLIGHALRERSSGLALSGGLVLHVAATAAYLLAISKGGLEFDASVWIRLAQLNAAIAASYALGWLVGLLRPTHQPPALSSYANDFALATQIALAPALTALVLAWAWGSLFWNPQGRPGSLSILPSELADLAGMLSFALVATLGYIAGRGSTSQLRMPALVAMFTALAIFAADWAAHWDRGTWLAYNTLYIGHGLIALLLLAVVGRGSIRRRGLELGSFELTSPDLVEPQTNWIVLQTAIIFLLAVREAVYGRWWAIAGFAFLGLVLHPALAWLSQRRRWLYFAACLINAAATLALARLRPACSVEDFINTNVIFLVLPVAGWLAIELQRIRPRTFIGRFGSVPVHRFAVWLALIVLALEVGAGLLADVRLSAATTTIPALHWIALILSFAAAVACLWDAQGKDSVALLYLLGIVAGGMLLHQFHLAPKWLLWMGTIVAAAYALATSYLWSRRQGLLAVADWLRIPRGSEAEFAGLQWLVPCNLALILAVIAMTVAIELSNPAFELRMLAAQATLVQVASLGLLARGDRRGVLQTDALVVGAIGAVLFGWAFLKIGVSLTPLNCLVVVVAALATVALLYSFGLNKLLRESNDWLSPAKRLIPWLASACGAAILAVLGIEIAAYTRAGEVAIAWSAIIVIAVTLAGLAVAAVAAAILPGRDPLGLSERGRSGYVYAAEVILALLFIHIRLTLPWLFTGLFQQYWPLIVMAIAFAGVGFAELCRRRQQHVLAKPIENTGALLPVLPVAGYWAVGSEVHYSVLLLAVGVLYAGLSIARRSFGFGVLAALAANGGLWYFLSDQEGLAFVRHPQVWLIPPALCILAAAYLNRGQLTEAQMTATRYVTSMTIYISSTGDIFLNGVAQAPWLPLVLGGLSIAGILLGIVLRVRAFLFLGTGFLLLSLFTIIWHAAVDLDQTWIWYASAVVMGILILAAFGLFERKRQMILETFDKIRQWEA